MKNKRKRHSSSFKAQVALGAAKEQKTLSELSSQYGLQATQISQWKSHLKNNAPGLFSAPTRKADDKDRPVDELYRQIGQLKVELDWPKKKVGG